MKTLTFFALGLIMTAQSVLACMAPPRPIIWYTPKGSDYHYSVTKKGVVTVVSAKDHDNVVWKATLTSYAQHVDRVHIVDNGNRIVCVHGNHRVKKLADVAIETIDKTGKTQTILAKELIGKLEPGTPPGQPRMSIAPKFRYMKSVKTIDAKGIEVVNAKGESKVLAWK